MERKETMKEELEEILKEIHTTGGIKLSVIASRHGLVIASITQGAETLAAMSATMLGAAETASATLEEGIPERLISETLTANIVIIGAGPKALLVVITEPGMGLLGLILINMKKAAGKIKNILQ